MKAKLILICLAILMLPAIGHTQGPYDYGAYWKYLSPGERIQYLKGFDDAITYGFFEMLSYNDNLTKGIYEKGNKQYIRDKAIVDVDKRVLSNVIAKLYNDPANTYIILHDMIYIARDDIEGKTIEYALLNARKKALAEHKAIMEFRNK